MSGRLFHFRRVSSQSFLYGFVFFASLFLSACATPSHRLSQARVATMPPMYHTVSKGETFYRIAKTYRVDVRELMRINQSSDPSALEVGRRLQIPSGGRVSSIPVVLKGPTSVSEIQAIVNGQPATYPWRTITLHHSGTLQGGARLFDKDHRRRRMGGLFYHFVIGNGTNSEDGQLEVGWRWYKQTKANRPNDIQICVVGDFDRQHISEAQYATLVYLIKALQNRSDIPITAVRKHCDIPGKHTDCPGKKFPFHRILQDLTLAI